jgi:hypothetical protein
VAFLSACITISPGLKATIDGKTAATLIMDTGDRTALTVFNHYAESAPASKTATHYLIPALPAMALAGQSMPVRSRFKAD